MLPSKNMAPVCNESLPFTSFQLDGYENVKFASENLFDPFTLDVVLVAGPVAIIIPITIMVISNIAPITILFSLIISSVLGSFPLFLIIGLSSKISSCIGAFVLDLGNLYPQFPQTGAPS